MLQAQLEAVSTIQRTESVYLRAMRKGSAGVETTLAKELQAMVVDADAVKKAVLSIGQVRERTYCSKLFIVLKALHKVMRIPNRGVPKFWTH